MRLLKCLEEKYPHNIQDKTITRNLWLLSTWFVGSMKVTPDIRPSNSIFGSSSTYDRSTKFDPNGILTHDLHNRAVYFMPLRRLL